MGNDSACILTTKLVDAEFDLNLHQAEAALLAVQGPLSKGLILASEVGLGKTVEAGLMIAQQWPNCKRGSLNITLTILRKQSRQELQVKFSLRALIQAFNYYRELVKCGSRLSRSTARATCTGPALWQSSRRRSGSRPRCVAHRHDTTIDVVVWRGELGGRGRARGWRIAQREGPVWRVGATVAVC